MDNAAIQEVDILIVGGGLIGASLMLALVQTPYKVLMVDNIPFKDRVYPDFDARSLALSPASVRLLMMLGVWPLMMKAACPIHKIHISEQYAFGNAKLKDDHGSSLGYVIELQHINHALQQHLDINHVIAPAQVIGVDKANNVATIQHDGVVLNIKAKLIVAADGTDSTVRKLCGLSANTKSYPQQAIVANIGLARSHHHIAYERFTPNGPLALLPMTDQRISLVWALSPEKAQQVMSLNDSLFLTQLQQAFGYRLGRFLSVGKRASYPLRQMTMEHKTCNSIVFIGNAAQTLHPVAGQGFNLGLRDVAMLAQCIVQKGLSTDTLVVYERLRESDQTSMTHFTNGLIQLFTSKLPGLKLARSAGLIAFEQLDSVKKILARYARGFGGIAPDLICEIPLKHEPNS